MSNRRRIGQGQAIRRSKTMEDERSDVTGRARVPGLDRGCPGSRHSRFRDECDVRLRPRSSARAYSRRWIVLKYSARVTAGSGILRRLAKTE